MICTHHSACTLTHTHTTASITYTLIYTHTHTTASITYTLMYTHTHTHTHTHSEIIIPRILRILTHKCQYPLCQPTHTHTHTHTHTRHHTHTHRRESERVTHRTYILPHT